MVTKHLHGPGSGSVQTRGVGAWGRGADGEVGLHGEGRLSVLGLGRGRTGAPEGTRPQVAAWTVPARWHGALFPAQPPREVGDQQERTRKPGAPKHRARRAGPATARPASSAFSPALDWLPPKTPTPAGFRRPMGGGGGAKASLQDNSWRCLLLKLMPLA